MVSIEECHCQQWYSFSLWTFICLHAFVFSFVIQYSSHPQANLVPRVWDDSTCKKCYPGTAQGPCGLPGSGALWKHSQLFCSCQSFPPTSIQLLLLYLKLLLIRNTFWFVMSPPNAEQNEYIFLRQLLIPLWWDVEQAPSWTSVSYGCWLPMQKDLSCCLLAVTQWCS